MVIREVFPMEPNINIANPKNENVFMMPNDEKKGDYYKNLCLSKSMTYINSKNGRKRYFSYETKASISLIPTRRECL